MGLGTLVFESFPIMDVVLFLPASNERAAIHVGVVHRGRLLRDPLVRWNDHLSNSGVIARY